MRSLETGWSVSASLGAEAPMGAAVSSELGYHSTETTEMNAEHVVGREISNTAAEDNTIMHYTTCGKDDVAGQTPTGLYQWVITNEAGNVNAYTPHTICRVGENAWKMPDCQFWDCLNADCSRCKGDNEVATTASADATATTDGTPTTVQPADKKKKRRSLWKRR